MQLQTIVEGQKAIMKVMGNFFDMCVKVPGDSLSPGPSSALGLEVTDVDG